MEKYKFIHSIIEFAVKNGIRYIADNSKRGVRNLLDLGGYFASGRFQKSFYDIAHEILNNEDSFYYDKIEDLVKNTNLDTLANFGINLGYNSLTYGANIIREVEREFNYRIPWTIVFDFREKSKNHLTKNEMLNVINIGKSYGIYCYIILMDNNDILLDLCPIIRNNTDCAFSIVVNPKIITDKAILEMSMLTNLCFLIIINDLPEDELINSLNCLRKYKCLYGGCYFYDDKNFLNITLDSTLSNKLISIQANFVMMIRKPTCTEEIGKKIYDYIYQSRFNTFSPAFMIDFYGDLKRVGNIIFEIPKEAHFIGIDSVGQISLFDLENKTKYNIRTNSIEEVLDITI